MKINISGVFCYILCLNHIIDIRRLYLSSPYLVALEKIYGGSVSGSLSDIGLAEPVKVYSNVCGGVGILGACQRAEKIVDIRNLIESTD